MIVSGVHFTEVDQIIHEIGRSRYGGNLVPSWRRRIRFPNAQEVESGEAEIHGNVAIWHDQPTLLNRQGTRWRGTISVWSSREAGARRSWSGRRLAAPCWHAYRDVIREILRQPKRRVTTSMARYTSENFEETYPATGAINIGSRMAPVAMPSLCECGDLIRGDDPIPPIVVTRRYVPMPAPRLVRVSAYAEPETDLQSRIDMVLNGTIEPGPAGTCLSCGRDTGSEAMNWCGPRCADEWHERKSGFNGYS